MKGKPMGTIERIAKFVASRRSWLTVATFSLFCNAGCADILGIDPPEPRVEGPSGSAGRNGVELPDDAGSSGESPSSASAGGSTHGAPVAGGGAAGSDVVSLSIGGPDTLAVCPGSDATLELRAQGGEGPYTWEIPETQTAFTVTAPAPHTERATLVGTLTRTGPLTLKVRVVDKNGLEASRTLTVSSASVPVIRLPQPLAVCPNELYTLDLKASGGDSSRYRWSTNLPESTGLAISGQQLSGKFRGVAPGVTHLDFELSVRDGNCPAAPLALSLNVESPSAKQCTSVYIGSQWANRPLPPPCLNSPYNQQLFADGGEGPFQWSASALPAGLSFDANTARISGILNAPGTFTVQLKDSKTGRTTETSFPLEPREKCWFAYVSNETGSQVLHFLDPILNNRKTLPQTGTDPVTDFKFSPSGEFLAYRSGPIGGPLNIAIVKLRTWQEEHFSFSNVRYYEWSPDSKSLAVAYGTGNSMLGGVNVGAELPSEPTGFIAFPTFNPILTPVDSAPVWFSGNHLAFFSTFVKGVVTLTTDTLDLSGFGNPSSYPEFLPPDTRLRSGTDGVFALGELSDNLFYGADGSAVVAHTGFVLAPTGQYLGRSKERSLQVFRAGDRTADRPASQAIPPAQQAGCDNVLSWAAFKDRIACSRLGTTQDELTFFDVDSSRPSPELSSAVAFALPVPAGDLTARSRVFSASGTRFAFMDADTLRVLNFESGTPQLESEVSFIPIANTTSGPFTELAFAPNEQRLLLHRASSLILFDMLNPDASKVTHDQLSSALPCTEDFKNQTATWCGNPRADAPFLWAPGSDLLAYQTAQGTLLIDDLTRYQYEIAVNDQCGTGCVVPGQFAFQP